MPLDAAGARRGALRGFERRRGARSRVDLSVRRALHEPRRVPRQHRGESSLHRSAVLRRDRQFLGARGRLPDLLAHRSAEPRHRGRQHHVHAGDAADGWRDRGAISVREICLRGARLSSLRMEVQRTQRAVTARRGALRLHVRGDFPPAHDRQGPQSRHGLVCDARQRVAGPQGVRTSVGSHRTISMPTAGRRSRSPTSCRRGMDDADDRRKARPLRRTACGSGLFCDSQSVRHRLGQISRFARLPGARQHKRRHGLRRPERAMAPSTAPLC